MIQYLTRICGVFLFAICLAIGGDRIALYQYPFDVKLGEPAIPADLRFDAGERASSYFYKIVHLNGKMDGQRRVALEGLGAEIVSYLPENAFVVRVEDPAILAEATFVDWVGDYHPAYKIHPGIGLSSFSPERAALGFILDISLHPGSPMSPTRHLIQDLGGLILAEVDAFTLQRFEVRFDDDSVVPLLARGDDVAWISEKGERALRNDRARWILQSYHPPAYDNMATPLYDRGLHGEGEVLGLIDSRVDLSHCAFRDPEGDEPGPDHRKFVYFNSGAIIGSHGTHVAGSLAGRNINGSLAGAGMAYEAKIAFTQSLGNQSGQLFDTLTAHADFGAVVHSNSWGEVPGSQVQFDYTVDCADIDTFTYHDEEALVVFACMNDASFPLGPLLSPENSINVLAVGATKSGAVAIPEILTDRHGSCRKGPTILDGRRKPEIFAPGCDLISARSSTECDYIANCGTSMATPLISASAALIRQYFREGFYPTGRRVAGNEMLPSGALLKATLLNGTANMLAETEQGPGIYADVPIPNDVEGWGRANLDNSLYFEGDCLRLMVEDVPNGEGLSTGEERTYSVHVLSADQPFRVTMVFTAPPATPGTTDPVINDLDLVVSGPEGHVFLGNFWNGGASIEGGSADARNNVEQFLLAAPVPGIYTVTVAATGVNMGTQGFALAMTGDITPSSCEDVRLDAGDDVALTCFGEQVQLGVAIPCGFATSVAWSPAEGLDNPFHVSPMASPAVTTTYTVSVSLGEDCLLQDSVTVVVPVMDLDENGELQVADLSYYAGSGHFGSALYTSDHDYDGDGRNDIRDMILLAGCLH